MILHQVMWKRQYPHFKMSIGTIGNRAKKKHKKLNHNLLMHCKCFKITDKYVCILSGNDCNSRRIWLSWHCSTVLIKISVCGSALTIHIIECFWTKCLPSTFNSIVHYTIHICFKCGFQLCHLQLIHTLSLSFSVHQFLSRSLEIESRLNEE